MPWMKFIKQLTNDLPTLTADRKQWKELIALCVSDTERSLDHATYRKG